MFTKDEEADLLDDAVALAYTAIRFSRLNRELENEQWDSLSEEWGKEIVSLLSAKCEGKLEAIAEEAMRATDRLDDPRREEREVA